MINFFRWIFWVVCFVLRIVMIVIGWVLPVHIGYNTKRTKGLNLWERYVENSWRNPTPYLRGVFKQPIKEAKPNPDQLVRGYRPTGKAQVIRDSATRIMVSGPYIEYWTLSKRDNKKRPYWEKRFGWKFVDKEETFWPTFQFGPRR